MTNPGDARSGGRLAAATLGLALATALASGCAADGELPARPSRGDAEARGRDAGAARADAGRALDAGAADAGEVADAGAADPLCGRARRLSADVASAVLHGDLAVGARGDIWVAYWAEDPMAGRVWVNRRGIDGAWGAAEPIDGSVVVRSTRPRIGVSGLGGAVVAWDVVTAALGFGVRAAARAPAGSWSTAEPIDVEPAGGRAARVVVDRSGRATLVFSRSPLELGARARRFDLASGWGSIEALGDEPMSPTAPAVEVDVDAAGSTFAVWTEADGDVWARRAAPRAPFGPPVRIASSAMGARALRLAVAPGGEAVALFDDGGLWAARYFADAGVWGRRVSLGGAAVGAPTEYDLGIDEAGVAVAVWTSAETGTVWASFGEPATPGGGWSPAEPIAAGDFGASPRVAMSGTGEAVVVWSESARVMLARGRSGAWAPAVELGPGQNAAVVVDRAGRAVVVYERSVGATSALCAIDEG